MPTCPAHAIIIGDMNRPGHVGTYDPLPEDCAKWLAKITMCLPARMHPDYENVDVFDYADLDGHELLRSVDKTGGQYRIYRKGNHLCVAIMQREQFVRFDLQITGWSND